jgi:type IV pilus assembly protein PilF
MLLPLLIAAVGCQTTGGAGSQDPYLPGAEVTPKRQSSNAHLTLAAAYYLKGDQSTALAESLAAVEQDPDNAEAYNVKALVEAKLQYWDRAKASFQKASSLAPANPEIQNNFGYFLCDRGERPDGLKYLKLASANQLYQERGKAFLNTARCQLDGGDTAGARATLTEGLTQVPGYAMLWRGLAELNYREKKFEEAGKMLQEFLVFQEPAADSLWLAYRIYRKLGNSIEMSAYGAQLQNRFPGSKEAAWLRSGLVDYLWHCF